MTISRICVRQIKTSRDPPNLRRRLRKPFLKLAQFSEFSTKKFRDSKTIKPVSWRDITKVTSRAPKETIS